MRQLCLGHVPCAIAGGKACESGFTLIELSIVLVIIGLIVGGVLTGQDLIKAAQVRATVTQLERYNTAVNTFRGKYNGLPGDLANPVSFFSGVLHANSSVAGEGNGDGVVQSISAAATTCAAFNCMAGENLLFWYELNAATYIPDNTNSINDMTNVTATMGPSVIPNAKVAGQIGVQAASGLNYWVFASITGPAVAGVPTYAASLTPIQAFQVDTKVDDGAPDTGIVVTITGGIPGVVGNQITSATMDTTHCATTVNDPTYPNVYAITSMNGHANANQVNCQISVRASF